MEQYFGQGVNTHAVRAFIDNIKAAKDGGEVHTLAVWRDGNLRVRLALPPYSCADKREVHSLSKIFTATAMGFLYDAGQLNLDEKIVDIFADRLDFEPDERLSAMTVRHVLAMNTGHAGCVMGAMYRAEDSVSAFLHQPLATAPGGRQEYNTGASCLLGSIVKQRTGLNLFDYLETKLFAPLGMENLSSGIVMDGMTEAGAGMHLCIDDILKLGRLYLQNGVWNGKRILSETWIREATKEQSYNGAHDSNFSNGYGLHWWCCYPDGYRGDGSMGQLCMVFPTLNAVVVEQGYMEEMDAMMLEARKLAAHLFDPESESAEMPQYLPPEPTGFPEKIPAGVYVCTDNAFGFTTLRLTVDNGGIMKLQISDGAQQQTIVCGCGMYETSEIWAKKLTPKLLGRMRDDRMERVVLACAWYQTGDAAFDISARFRSSVYPETWHITYENGTLHWDFQNTRFRGEDCRSLSARLVTEL